jgi:ParB-like chromosome segregation protein Spo0J
MSENVEVVVDAEFRGMIPPLSREEYKLLEEDIIANGCRDAIVLWKGIVLDGHNRLQVCQEHGLPYRTVQVDLPDREAAMLWMAKNQLGRRNLSNWQKAKIVLKLEPIFAAQAKARVLAGIAAEAGQDSRQGRTLDQLGSLVDLGKSTLHLARRLLNGPADLIESLDAGELSITGASALLDARLAEAEAIAAKASQVQQQSEVSETADKLDRPVTLGRIRRRLKDLFPRVARFCLDAMAGRAQVQEADFGQLMRWEAELRVLANHLAQVQRKCCPESCERLGRLNDAQRRAEAAAPQAGPAPQAADSEQAPAAQGGHV